MSKLKHTHLHIYPDTCGIKAKSAQSHIIATAEKPWF